MQLYSSCISFLFSRFGSDHASSLFFCHIPPPPPLPLGLSPTRRLTDSDPFWKLSHVEAESMRLFEWAGHLCHVTLAFQQTPPAANILHGSIQICLCVGLSLCWCACQRENISEGIREKNWIYSRCELLCTFCAFLPGELLGYFPAASLTFWRHFTKGLPHHSELSEHRLSSHLKQFYKSLE